MFLGRSQDVLVGFTRDLWTLVLLVCRLDHKAPPRLTATAETHAHSLPAFCDPRRAPRVSMACFVYLFVCSTGAKDAGG